MINRKSVSDQPLICYGVFHVESKNCAVRHGLKDELVKNIGNTWINLEVQTFYFSSLEEAEESARDYNFSFNHIAEDRKPGLTGFMKGEIGIWIGTIMSLRKFLDSNFDILVLFEDDIISSGEGVSIANSYLRKNWRVFDVFALYTPENQYFMYGRKRHIRAYITKHFNDKSDLPTKLFQHWSVASYAISKIGAERILRSIETEIVVPVDWHIFRGKFKSLSFKPNGPKPFSLANLDSTIQNDRQKN